MHLLPRENALPYLVLVIISTLFALGIAILPTSFFIANFIPDDSFYYFKIAQFMSNGMGPTVDGINLTNGFHPLWLGVLVFVVSLAKATQISDPVLITSALWLGLLGFTISTFFLIRILEHLKVKGIVAVAALMFWVFNPLVWALVFSGLETMFAAMFLSIVTYMILTLSSSPSLKELLMLGALLAGMVLARLDFVFIAALALLWILVRSTTFREGLRNSVVAGIPTLIFVLLYLLWSVLVTGALVPSSSAATTLVQRSLVFSDTSSFFQMMSAPFTFAYDSFLDGLRAFGASPIFLMIMGMGVGLLLSGQRKFIALVRSPLFFLFAGVGILFLSTVFVRFTVREWYFMPVLLLSVPLVAIILSGYRPKTSRIISVVLLFMAAPFFLAAYQTQVEGREVSNLDRLEAATWINHNLPEDAIIGSFNSGALAFFTNRSVVNLDGLVNLNGLEALRKHELLQYMEDSEIMYVIDYNRYLSYRFAAFFGDEDVFTRLTLVDTFTVGGENREALLLYEFK